MIAKNVIIRGGAVASEVNGKVCEEIIFVYLDGKPMPFADAADTEKGWVHHLDAQKWVDACLAFKRNAIKKGIWHKLKNWNPPISKGYIKSKGHVELIVNPSQKTRNKFKRHSKKVVRDIKRLFNSLDPIPAHLEPIKRKNKKKATIH